MGGRKYWKEDHCSKTVIQYESKGVTEEMRKQIALSNCSTESDAHPPPGTWQRLVHKARETHEWYWEDEQPSSDENHMLLIPNVILG